MKMPSYLIFVVLIISCSEPIVQNNAIIEFENTAHNFEELNFKQKAEYAFEFLNPGNSPIIVYNVVTKCGCTVPDWPKEPIKHSQKGEIKIKYDTSRPGIFSKTIKVFYNGKASPVKLKINGSVDYPKDKTSN